MQRITLQYVCSAAKVFFPAKHSQTTIQKQV